MCTSVDPIVYAIGSLIPLLLLVVVCSFVFGRSDCRCDGFASAFVNDIFDSLYGVGSGLQLYGCSCMFGRSDCRYDRFESVLCSYSILDTIDSIDCTDLVPVCSCNIGVVCSVDPIVDPI